MSTHESVLKVDLSRGSDEPDVFAHLAPPLRAKVNQQGVDFDLLDGLRLEADLTLQDGIHPLPLFHDRDVDLEIRPDTRAKLLLRAGREEAAGQTRLQGMDLRFSSPLIIRDVLPILARLATLFDDRTIEAVTDRVFRTTNKAEDMLLAAAPGLAPWLAAGARIKDSLVPALRRLPGRIEQNLLGGTDPVADVLLRRITASPVLRKQEWEIDLRFTGEIRYFGSLLVPFENFLVPRQLIPSFHATLNHLLTDAPMASARLRRDRIPGERLMAALYSTLVNLNGSFESSGRLPRLEFAVDTTSRGRVAVSVAPPGDFRIRGACSARFGIHKADLQIPGASLRLADQESQVSADFSVALDPDAGASLLNVVWDRELRDRLQVQGNLHLAPDSALPVLPLSIRTSHELTTSSTEAELDAGPLVAGGEAGFRYSGDSGTLEHLSLDLAYHGAFSFRDTSFYDNGRSRLQGRRLEGDFSGRVKASGPDSFQVRLDGKAGADLLGRTQVEAFPELDIDEGLLETHVKADADFSILVKASAGSHGPADFDFSASRMDLEIGASSLVLGGRRADLPRGTRVNVQVNEGLLATTGLGRAVFGMTWDMGGRSPVLKGRGQELEVFVPDLRQGSFDLSLSPAGGMEISGPEGGLYDARYFNALLNPGREPSRWLDILENDEAIDKVVATVRVLSDEAADLLERLRRLVDRIRRVFEEEDIREPRDVIPADRMARLLSLLRVDDDSLQQRIHPIVLQVVGAGGLDVPAMKKILADALPEHGLEFEMDRLLRLMDHALSPVEPESPFPPMRSIPLAENPEYLKLFEGIPSAAELYRAARADRLPAGFADRLVHVAPYLTRRQVDWLYEARRWPARANRRLRHIRDLKERVRLISRGYGGVGFTPQAFAISFFLGETLALSRMPAADKEPHPLLPDCLLGPQDVAVLLHSGLASAWSGRAVQLNQRLLLDLLSSMPRLFVQAVLVELGGNNPRVLAGVLLALLDLDQGKLKQPLDVAAMLEKSLGISVPRRVDYMAGGRWARMSYYEALNRTAERIVGEAELWRALKYYLQEARHPVPRPRRSPKVPALEKKLAAAIARADRAGAACSFQARSRDGRKKARDAYEAAFARARELMAADPRAFQREPLKPFWARNYEALMVRSVVRNVQENTDEVRRWLRARSGRGMPRSEQNLLDRVIYVMYFRPEDREALRADPLVRLLLDPPEDALRFSIISCMGVITEGRQGTELQDAYERLQERYGVRTIRADTETSRSLEYNAHRITDAIRQADTPWGFVGYSQGCANALMTEHRLRSGTPDQQALLKGLRCRNLLFSALNGSAHGTAGDTKFLRVMIDLDHYLSHYQAVFSQQAIDLALRTIRLAMDARPAALGMMGIRSLSRWGVLALNRGGQFLDTVPTSIIRGIVEPETLPESLEFFSNILTAQIESELHDTQVAAHEAVGHPLWVRNHQTEILERCDTSGLIQRTHHWSPLCHREVDMVTTGRDRKQAIYDAPKDRHVFPWVEVNARFGVIS